MRLDTTAPSFCGTKIGVTGPTCRWPHRVITYRLEHNLPGLSAGQIERGFVEAIQPWQEEANITMEPRAVGPVNLLVIDVRIDGPDGFLADCQLPCGLPADFQLTMRFDNLDTWDYDRYVKTARHELGHGLGLGHASERGNIMYPTLDVEVARLGPGDIGEVLQRYGRRTTPFPMPVPGGLPNIFDGSIAIRGVSHRLVRSDRAGTLGRLIGRARGPWGTVTIPGDDGRSVEYFLSPDTPT